jgi:hypothetical protein
LIEILGEARRLKLLSQQDLQFRDRLEGQIAHIGIIVPIRRISKDKRYIPAGYDYLTFTLQGLAKVGGGGGVEPPPPVFSGLPDNSAK